MLNIVGVDIGGTFTDVVALDERNGQLRSAKALTVHGNQSEGVLACLQELGISPESMARLVHGTTIGTNAILERRGVPTALLATRGFRDLLEIGRTRRMMPNTLFDLTFRRPEPLVPRLHRFDIQERLLASGEVLEPLDQDALRAILDTLSRSKVQSIAVCFLHSYVNSRHELQARDAIVAALPGISVSLSHQVVPEYREFERMSTTVLNAYVAPLLDAYLDSLVAKLCTPDTGGRLFIMASNGGIMSVGRAKQFPSQTILSGPAGGVMAGVLVGQTIAARNLITYDMGGTSTDVSMVRDLRPRLTFDNVITGLPLKVPQVDINTVGAGGGSIAWIDADGQLRVGPRSAGSDPGPICYGRGGNEVTVTDANLLLGRLALHRKLGGKIAPTLPGARSAVRAMADQLGLESEYRMAEGIIRIAVAKMVASIREISVARGHDPRECALVAFGGAGPMHATQIAEELQMDRVVVPPFAGSFSALGLLSSDLRHDVAETLLVPNSPSSTERIAEAFTRLTKSARERLAADGFSPGQTAIECSLDLRYQGQAFELTIPLELGDLDSQAIQKRFHAAYAEAYGHANEDQKVEIVNARVAGIARTAKPVIQGSIQDGVALIEKRPVWFSGWVEGVPVFDREAMPRNGIVRGPAVIEETGATTVVFPDWAVRRDAHDNLLLDRLS